MGGELNRSKAVIADFELIDHAHRLLHCTAGIGMNLLRQIAVGGWPKLAKTSLASALIFSLLFLTQAGSIATPARMQMGGMCAGMNCEHGCCADMACCHVVEQGKTPPAALGSKQHAADQLAAPEPRVCTILAILEPRERHFVNRDEIGVPHRVSPLITSGVWLI
jgi:hypothetical protein